MINYNDLKNKKLDFNLIVAFALIDSIAHWERMTTWAKTQNPRKTKSSDEMFMSIAENHYDKHCSLCSLFKYDKDKKIGCWDFLIAKGKNQCPLDKAGYSCYGEKGWIEVQYQRTWGGFVIEAENMIEILKKCYQQHIEKNFPS